LYAPTFRDDFSVDGYKINFQNVLSAFSEKMKKKCVIVVKLHPNAKKNSQFIQYTDDIIDGSDYPDVQRLEIASDCLISDYSSTIVDGMLLKKPVFVCALDLNDYEKNRGLMKEFYEFPIMYAYSNAELIRNIEEFEYDKYLDGLKQYNEKFPSYDCGNAACSIANYINDIMCDLSGKKDIEQ
jgi:CDP-glycerol glycerophosphotransferase